MGGGRGRLVGRGGPGGGGSSLGWGWGRLGKGLLLTTVEVMSDAAVEEWGRGSADGGSADGGAAAAAQFELIFFNFVSSDFLTIHFHNQSK